MQDVLLGFPGLTDLVLQLPTSCLYGPFDLPEDRGQRFWSSELLMVPLLSTGELLCAQRELHAESSRLAPETLSPPAGGAPRPAQLPLSPGEGGPPAPTDPIGVRWVGGSF